MSGVNIEDLVNYLLIVMVTLFFCFLIFMVLVHKLCPSYRQENENEEEKKLDSACINKYLPSERYESKINNKSKTLDLEKNSLNKLE